MPMAGPDHLRRPALRLSVRACFDCCGPPFVSLVLLPRSSRLFAPLDRVGERGAWASGFIAARRGLPRAGGGALRGSLLRSNEETGTMRRCVDYVNCLSSVDWHGCRGVYSISCLIDGASAVFVGFLSRCLISPGKACGCFAPARSRVFSFLRERRGRFFFINAISLNTYSGAACLPVPRLRFNGINA